MSLSTITHADCRAKKRVITRTVNSSLNTADIDQAQPRLKPYIYTKKPDFTLKTDDIAGTRAAELYPVRNKPFTSLETGDIAKARRVKPVLVRARSGLPPLNPVYKLPHCETDPATPPRFLRDFLNVNDIEGTKPSPYYRWKTRENIGVEDIEGAQPRVRKFLNRPDLRDVRDINKAGCQDLNRSTNPLTPEYITQDETGQLVKIGPILGNKPRQWVTPIEPHCRHLSVQDITGSQVGTVGKGPFLTVQRKDFRLVTTEDILGAQAGTLKKVGGHHKRLVKAEVRLSTESTALRDDNMHANAGRRLNTSNDADRTPANPSFKSSCNTLVHSHSHSWTCKHPPQSTSVLHREAAKYRFALKRQQVLAQEK